MPEVSVVIDLNPREERLYERFRSRVSPRRTGGSSGLTDLLLLLPDLVVLLVRLLRDDRVPAGAKLVALAGVGYVLSPVDLLPTFLFGPLGLVDDLIIVGAALARLLGDVHPDVVRSHWSGKGDALEAIHRVTTWSDGLLRVRFVGALRRIFR